MTLHFNHINDRTWVRIRREVRTHDGVNVRVSDVVSYELIYEGLAIIRHNGTGVTQKPQEGAVNYIGQQKADEMRVYLDRSIESVLEEDWVEYNQLSRGLNGANINESVGDFVRMKVNKVLRPSRITRNGRIELICITNN